MDDVDEHMARHERMQPISTAFDVELSNSGGDQWRKSSFTGYETLEDAGVHLDKMAGILSDNISVGFGENMPLLRVTKVVTYLEFEHLEVENAPEGS